MTLLNAAPIIIATTDSSWLHQVQNWPQVVVIVGGSSMYSICFRTSI